MSSFDADCAIVTPPFCPTDAGPPLGPAVLATAAHEAGLELVQLDLSIRYLRSFPSSSNRNSAVTGDHAKDRERVAAARHHFQTRMPLEMPPESRMAPQTDPTLALSHTFDEIERALSRMDRGSFWSSFLWENLFSQLSAPRVLGISMMGPSQVMVGLLAAKMAKRIWPSTPVIAGGSHITILAAHMASEKRYGEHIDLFLPGHSEQVLMGLLWRVRRGEEPAGSGILAAGSGVVENRPPSGFPLAPLFNPDELELYDKQHAAVPIQFSRGCSFGECTMCTYPAVEEHKHGCELRLDAETLETLGTHPIRKMSVKDAFMRRSSLRNLAFRVTESDEHWEWSATTKAASWMTPTAMAELFEGGCRTLELGIETIHPKLQALLHKPLPMKMVEGAIEAAAGAGIAVVVNLIYGLPGETEQQACEQLDWFLFWKRRYPDLVHGSHNLLEINRGSPMSQDPKEFGIELRGIGPWAFSYSWNAPGWRESFEPVLREATRSVQRAGEMADHQHSPVSRKNATVATQPETLGVW